MSIKVSVIIPNYNHAKYLHKRIASVLEQTFQDIEIILLDDCSTDDSRKILIEYKDNPKVSHIVFNKENSGSTFRQWTKGIKLAKGEWIWIAESDDWCEPSLLAELITPVLTNTEITISFCQSVLINTEGKVIASTSAENLYEVVDGCDFVKKDMLPSNRILNASMTIFKKSCFENVPDDYINMIYCGDWFIWVNICIQGKVFISGKYLNYYVRHDNNVATTAEKKGYEFLEGNMVFRFIIKTLNVSLQEKETALNIIIDTYIRKKAILLNETIRSQVFESIIALDPSVKKIISKKYHQKKLEKKRSIMFRFLSIPFKAANLAFNTMMKNR